MTELIVAVLGAAGGLIILRLFDKYITDKHQQKLEARVKENDKKVAGLEGEQRQEDKETKEKVDEIEKQQNEKPSTDKLVDFFNSRK